MGGQRGAGRGVEPARLSLRGAGRRRPGIAPSACRWPNGDFVVVDERYLPDDVGRTSIVAQRFGPTAIAHRPAVQVAGSARGGKRAPDVACRPDGGFVVVWADPEDPNDIGELPGVFTRAFGPDGLPAAAARVDLGGTGLAAPALARAPDGDFFVVWERAATVFDDDIVGRRLDQDGRPVGDERTLAATSEDELGPTIASTGGGDFVVAWTERFGDVRAQRLGADGMAGAAIRIDGRYEHAAVAGLGDGFVLAWSGGDASRVNAVRGQRFDAADAPSAHLDRINVVRPRTPGCEECLRDGTR